jgi:hypothetical protein
MNNELQLSWNRGSSAKGQSDTKRPDKDGLIEFNCDFEVKATIYISRGDGQIRPKKLNLVLRRFTDSHDSAIYGKLTLDIGRYYRYCEVVRESLEMESGRSVAPIVNAVFVVVPAGTVTDGFETDQSYLEDSAPRNPLAEWDRTEIDPAVAEPPAAKKRKKKHLLAEDSPDAGSSSDKRRRRRSDGAEPRKKMGGDSESDSDTWPRERKPRPGEDAPKPKERAPKSPGARGRVQAEAAEAGGAAR